MAARIAVRLAEGERDLRVTVKVSDTSLNHAVVQVVSLAGALADTCGRTDLEKKMRRKSDVACRRRWRSRRKLERRCWQPPESNSPADTGTTEKLSLFTTGVRREEVDDLDAGLEGLDHCGLVDEGRGLGVDGAVLHTLKGPTLVDRLTNHARDAAEGVAADRDMDWSAGVDSLLDTDETLDTVHGNGTDRVLIQVRGGLEDQMTATEVLGLKGVEDRQKRSSVSNWTSTMAPMTVFPVPIMPLVSVTYERTGKQEKHGEVTWMNDLLREGEKTGRDMEQRGRKGKDLPGREEEARAGRR